MQQTLQVDDNPMRAIAQLLSTTYIAADAMREVIRLMDVPVSQWKIRQLAMKHVDTLQEELKPMMEAHTEVCAQLKGLGY
jgi:hypothetical protein